MSPRSWPIYLSIAFFILFNMRIIRFTADGFMSIGVRRYHVGVLSLFGRQWTALDGLTVLFAAWMIWAWVVAPIVRKAKG